MRLSYLYSKVNLLVRFFSVDLHFLSVTGGAALHFTGGAVLHFTGGAALHFTGIRNYGFEAILIMLSSFSVMFSLLNFADTVLGFKNKSQVQRFNKDFL